MPPFVILSRVLTTPDLNELAVQYNVGGNFTLQVYNAAIVPDAQRWVLNPAPPSITPVIPVPAADRQAAEVGAFIQAPQQINPNLWTVDAPGAPNLFWYVFIAFSTPEQMNQELHFLNISAFKRPVAMPGVQEPRSPAWT
ncbi:hypothetical protein BS47DRAFT_836646 [Hydnum rufescens UP504]|uniref:Uncharacterized protein n=1 Tax=Hydnum rufescens UP504 TaxID=1448309 RepID=A0A9P6AC63_9AGAM|nr:hypothetical protein BS47DRAFT_836646 [Hydnum rufescens UP504]